MIVEVLAKGRLQLVGKRADGRTMSDAFCDSSRPENAVGSTVRVVSTNNYIF